METIGANLTPRRHERGWRKIELQLSIVEMGQSWRFCIEPMGYRDAVWERSGYVELIIWRRLSPTSSSA